MPYNNLNPIIQWIPSMWVTVFDFMKTDPLSVGSAPENGGLKNKLFKWVNHLKCD